MAPTFSDDMAPQCLQLSPSLAWLPMCVLPHGHACSSLHPARGKHTCVLQITVQMQVDRSRWVCGAVVRGELDVALVGGEVPAEHYEHLQVGG